MKYHVYITGIGESPKPSTTVLKSGTKMDRAFILNNEDCDTKYKQSESMVKAALEGATVDGAAIRYIDPLDFYDILSTVLDIESEIRIQCYEKGRDTLEPVFHMNFTSGTRVMSAAIACASMMCSDSELCYVRNAELNPELTVEDQMVHITPGSLVDAKMLKGALREVFQEIASEPDGLNNCHLVKANRKNNTVTSHTKKLVELGLIVNTSQGRSKTWKLTEKGMATRALMIRDRHRSANIRAGSK